MYQVLLFKSRLHLCKGSMGLDESGGNLALAGPYHHHDHQTTHGTQLSGNSQNCRHSFCTPHHLGSIWFFLARSQLHADQPASLDAFVAGKFVEYYRRCVLLLKSDGVAIVIVDEHGCGRGTIKKTICPAGKYSCDHCRMKKTRILIDL